MLSWRSQAKNMELAE